MFAILKYILLSAIRDRLYIGLLITIAASFALSIFLGSTMTIEQAQTSSAYIAGSSRAILAVGFILFVCLNVTKAFENKEVEFIISKAISRQKFVMGYLLGFFLALIIVFLPLVIAIFFITKPTILGLASWSLSLLAELFIVISFALLAALILKNSLLAIMSSFGFYIISRLMGVFVMAINLPESISQAKSKTMEVALKFLSAIFPRLDLYAQSSWLSYEIKDLEVLKIIFFQSLIFIPLMIFMAFHDFKKKQF